MTARADLCGGDQQWSSLPRLRRAQICMGKPASVYESSPLGRKTGDALYWFQIGSLGTADAGRSKVGDHCPASISPNCLNGSALVSQRALRIVPVLNLLLITTALQLVK